ncbi:MAG: TetR/AcrR family transcriptional regulator [Novosphingobium sp.]
MTSKREMAKEGRRQAILNAAERLIEETGETDFSMKQLAERAGISTFTTYNLIGQKAEVLYTLLDRSLDDIDALAMMQAGKIDPVTKPLEYLFEAVDNIVHVFTGRSALYKPLFRFLLGVRDATHRPNFMKRSSDYWRFAYAPLDNAGLIKPPVQKIDMVRQAQHLFTGVLEYWVHDDLSDKDFSDHIRHGYALHLLALNIPGSQAILAQRLAKGRDSIVRAIGE